MRQHKQNKTNMLFDLIVYKMTDEWFIEWKRVEQRMASDKNDSEW